jgi:aspartate-semialdehyde dehydrogenase
MSDVIEVAILGATGTVGQKYIRLLEGHPQFRITELVASDRSAGKPYVEAVSWKQETPIPEAIQGMTIKALSDSLTSRILMSGLDTSVAGDAETRYAEAGHVVISNSSNHRMDSNVPLVIPEINADHFELTRQQPWPGAIITNCNCSAMFLAMALAPIDQAFGVTHVQVSTMQGITGAGYPGVSGIDILGNVVPFIRTEEEKMEEETAKILGTLDGDHIRPHKMVLSAQCNRVPVYDGHTETVSIKLERSASPEDVKAALRDFGGVPQARSLPSAPTHPIVVLEGEDRPQPARDIWLENGMAAVVGRVRRCPVFDVKMVVLGHNTVRGAAGAAILNAEAYVDLGYLEAGD